MAHQLLQLLALSGGCQTQEASKEKLGKGAWLSLPRGKADHACPLIMTGMCMWCVRSCI